MTIQPLEVTVPYLEPPDGRDFWVDPTEGGRPIFSAKEVSTVFYGRTKLWIHRQFVNENHRLDGKLIEIPKTPAGYYQFQLGHVERLSHAFLAHGSISLPRFQNSILIIRSIALNYRLV